MEQFQGLVPRKSHYYVPKGWGWELWVCNNEKYCGKILFLKQGKRCSWHYHNLKDEHFYLQDGRLLLRYGYDDDITKATEIELSAGDIFHVTIGMRHQMQALEDAHLFEFSTTHFDSDSIRVKPGD